MKFNKLYILPLLGAALSFGACSNDDESIFDQSAAERLEAGQKEYFSTLCADGGIWAMEYFSNTEEPGYLFVMKFNADKSVDIHTDHKWIGSTYKTERSLWDVINDNGNVLSFNSYNTLFHIFSTPENIEGNDAPKDTNGEDVDEQGYGHNGDYEFVLMENNNGTIRLLGKKRALYTYLRHLPSDTDIQKYLADAAAKRKLFTNKKFPTYLMVETVTGAEYDVSGLGNGVVSVMPHNTTSQYSRTETKACIITSAGLRPFETFDFIRENDSHFTVNQFTWADDGSLVAPGVRITAPTPATNLLRQDLKWTVNISDASNAVINAIDAANAQTVNIGGSPEVIEAFGRNPKIKNIEIGYYTNVNGKILAGMKTTLGNMDFYCFGTFEKVGDNKMKLNFNDNDEALTTYILPVAPAVQSLLNLLSGEYNVTNIASLDASVINFEKGDVKFSAKVK